MIRMAKAEWSDPVRVEAERSYKETDLSVAEIARRLALSPSTIFRWRRAGNWQRPEQHQVPDAPSRRSAMTTATGTEPTRRHLGRRLLAAIAVSIDQLEQRMSEDYAGTAADHERQSRIIGSLARTLDKVKEIDTDQRTAGSDAAKTVAADVDETEQLRRALVERLVRLRQRHGA